MAYLGIDVGTSTVKVGILNDNGDVMVERSDLPDGASSVLTGELDAEQWWVATCQALRKLSDRADLGAVRAIAAIGNTPTLICVDASGNPLAPALLWSDNRAQREAQELLAQSSQKEWNRVYGTFMPVAATYPSAKLRWLLKHRPDVLKNTAKIIQPKDFINARLTGVLAGDAWTSKGLVNIDNCSKEPLIRLGMDPALAPDCARPVDIIGGVTTFAAQVTGLRPQTPVAAGWSDTLGAVLSLGLGANEGFVLSGTSDSVGIIMQGPPKASEAVLDAPVWDTGYHIVYGPTSSGMSTIQWARTIFPDFDAIVAAPNACQSERPLFIPYLLGQRSPIWSDQVRGAWLHVGMDTTREALATAVLEGIAWSERDVLMAVEETIAQNVQKVVVTGGGARMPILNRWRAAVFHQPLELCETEPVLGAALLALWADPLSGRGYGDWGPARLRRDPFVHDPIKGFCDAPYPRAKLAALCADDAVPTCG
jgi:xylulokinase